MNTLVLDHVCKSFGEVCAVDNLSLRVPAGSIYGLLGPNGAGKTTTIRMIMNILRPDRGRIEIFGGCSLRKAKHRIGYMPEERGLYRRMSVRKVLAYFGSLKGVTAAEVPGRASHWLDRVGLGGWADKRVEELSRGMQQKLQFAVTVVNDPELLVLDEPFAGLDPLNVDLLKEIIMEMRGNGKTVIFSTHVMHEAEKLCDFILLVNRGKVILDDTLPRVRSQHRSHTVCVELEGNASFVKELPIVTEVKSQGSHLEISLADNADSQELLRTLLDNAAVRRFEVKTLSLHEIFVNLVGKSNE